MVYRSLKTDHHSKSKPPEVQKTFRVNILWAVRSQISDVSCKTQQRGGANRSDKAVSKAFKSKISLEKLKQSPPLAFLEYLKTLALECGHSLGMWDSSVLESFPCILFYFNMPDINREMCLHDVWACLGMVENWSQDNKKTC